MHLRNLDFFTFSGHARTAIWTRIQEGDPRAIIQTILGVDEPQPPAVEEQEGIFLCTDPSIKDQLDRIEGKLDFILKDLRVPYEAPSEQSTTQG
jgi:hypothetical protein